MDHLPVDPARILGQRHDRDGRPTSRLAPAGAAPGGREMIDRRLHFPGRGEAGRDHIGRDPSRRQRDATCRISASSPPFDMP
ncbi:hypothetical protein [Sphingobium sp.]|uniref:hypothetical protein n=1 Tax=Sphingobium sp. TaxID=1912891 RepID=UPI0035C7050C